MFKTPIIVLNVKTYIEATGKHALKLASLMDTVSEETGVAMAIAVQATDIYPCSQQGSLPVFAEHIDAISPGSHTGWTLPQAVKQAGAQGTLINHSEHRLNLADIESTIKIAQTLGLDHIVCTNNIATSQAAAGLHPQSIAVEPPELIGGDISVTTADPDVVSGSVKAVKSIHADIAVLCGAGVKNGKDVATSIELGADGVLLASGVVKAKDKEQVLRDLASGL